MTTWCGFIAYGNKRLHKRALGVGEGNTVRKTISKGKIIEELIGVVNEWDRAMVENDVEEIGQFMADDWTIIGADGSVGDKATFLELVKSGTLSHDLMESEDFQVRVYGDTAIVTALGVSGGKYQGQAFREVERSSCVFVRHEGRWRCVLTHLSRLALQEDR